jgi:Phage tail tube protein
MVAWVSAITPQKAFLNIAPETTPGTAATTGWLTVPITKPNFDDTVKKLDDPAIRGSMAELYGRYAGVRQGTVSFGGPFYPDIAGLLLQNILGDKTTTGAADPYTHAFSLNNSATGQPKTHTCVYYTGVTATSGARTFPGLCLSELKLSWDAESKLVSYTAKGVTVGSTITGSTPTAAPSAVPPMAAWRALMGVGGPASGGTLDPTCTSFELTLKRKVDLIYGLANSQDPIVIQRGQMSCDGKAKFVARDEVPLLNMINNTQGQVQILLDNGIVGAGQRGMTVNFQQASWLNAKLDEGKQATMWDVEIDGIANSTDAGATGGLSPLKVTLVNGNAGTVY